jgi:quinol monooxygenase YgiN
MTSFAELETKDLAPTNAHLVKFVVIEGRRDEFVETLRPMFEEVENEPGTLLYMMHTCPSDPNVVWFYERYADLEAFEIHQASATHHGVVAKMRPLLSPTSEIHFLDLVESKTP